MQCIQYKVNQFLRFLLFMSQLLYTYICIYVQMYIYVHIYELLLCEQLYAILISEIKRTKFVLLKEEGRLFFRQCFNYLVLQQRKRSYSLKQPIYRVRCCQHLYIYIPLYISIYILLINFILILLPMSVVMRKLGMTELPVLKGYFKLSSLSVYLQPGKSENFISESLYYK